MVVVLGDHGRHEAAGVTEVERQVGHFMTPLLIWLDQSVWPESGYRPRTVSAIASQVDLAPTILSLNGFMPHVSPFVGRNLSCLLTTECQVENRAFLSSVYDDLIGLVENDRLLLYSLRNERLVESRLDLMESTVRQPKDPAVAEQYRRLWALYSATNALLERNQLWSWARLGGEL